MELTTSLSKSGLFTSREDKKDQVETYFKEEIKAGSSIYTKSMFKSKKFTNNQNLVSNVSCLKYYIIISNQVEMLKASKNFLINILERKQQLRQVINDERYFWQHKQ